MNPEKNINENEQLELEEQIINEPKNAVINPLPNTHPSISPLPDTHYGMDVTKQDEPQPYKPTHSMSNEELDELK